ncbi:MAG: FeoA domain-containing protein [Deltaproteobacteria bacterium]
MIRFPFLNNWPAKTGEMGPIDQHEQEIEQFRTVLESFGANRIEDRLTILDLTQYEHRHLGQHHDHFICTRCGSIQEFVNPGLERLQMAIAKDLGFHPLQHKMEIYGLCADCINQRDDTIPLLMAANGEKVQIVRIAGGREMQARLTAMGLTVGTCLQVINNHAAGPFIVAIEDSRMALGTGMAQKIMVVHACLHKS